MPFITEENRKIINEQGLDGLPEIVPGDICYSYYKPMVDEWKANPRWTTAHGIYKNMLFETTTWPPMSMDYQAAYQLAWQVFFAFHVLPYEREAEKRNGSI